MSRRARTVNTVEAPPEVGEQADASTGAANDEGK